MDCLFINERLNELNFDVLNTFNNIHLKFNHFRVI